MASDRIRFILNGDVVETEVTDPTRTVLQFLREDLRLTGTKEGCAEGDCGACTVVVVDIERDGDGIRVRAINSCIQLLPTLDGRELITVEGLRDSDGGLHPVQQAMVEEHGSQCGFCTPGFVMALYALYRNTDNPTRRDIDDALAGNLCRCTGYRPIIAAAQSMVEHRDEWDGAQHEAQLRAVDRDEALEITHEGRRFFAPRDIGTFAELYESRPHATLLAGGTDVGLWVTKQHRELNTIIYTGRVRELLEQRVSETHIVVGGAVSLTDAIPLLVEHYPGLDEMFRRFASPPIRNAATLGGNIANGSPIGDSMPALMVLGASLVLRKGVEQRELPLDEFYRSYQENELQPGEFVAAIHIPLPQEGVVVSSQKWSKRFDQDISAVCTAYRLQLDGDAVSSFSMACGGLAEIVKRASNCEKAINGADWNEATIETACAALEKDFAPITDMRATAEMRLVAAQNLLRRFYLETVAEAPQTVYTYGR
jgi:xanthine dehydrogenase small subunit